MSTETKHWSARRISKRLSGKAGAVIEYVPPTGVDPEPRNAYFWIGDDKGHFATIDALDLAKFMDKVRGA